jgi:hypothetical protein
MLLVVLESTVGVLLARHVSNRPIESGQKFNKSVVVCLTTVLKMALSILLFHVYNLNKVSHFYINKRKIFLFISKLIEKIC